MPVRDYNDVRKERPNWFPVEQPMLDDELVPRVFGKFYAETFAYRLTPIDYSVIPEMVRIAENTPRLDMWWKTHVIYHLTDAARETLPQYVRTQHFDIAGSRYWEGTGRGRYAVPRFMYLFKRAGGQ